MGKSKAVSTQGEVGTLEAGGGSIATEQKGDPFIGSVNGGVESNPRKRNKTIARSMLDQQAVVKEEVKKRNIEKELTKEFDKIADKVVLQNKKEVTVTLSQANEMAKTAVNLVLKDKAQDSARSQVIAIQPIFMTSNKFIYTLTEIIETRIDAEIWGEDDLPRLIKWLKDMGCSLPEPVKEGGVICAREY